MSNHDPYTWLESGDSTETRQWLTGQRRSIERALQSTQIRQTVWERCAALLTVSNMDLPCAASGRIAFNYRADNQVLPACFWRSESTESVSLLAESIQNAGSGRTPSVHAISSDGKRVAIGWRTDCRDELDVQVIEIGSGRILSECLPSYEKHRTVLDEDLNGCIGFAAGESSLNLYFWPIPSKGACTVLLQENLPWKNIADLSVARLANSPWLLLMARKSNNAFDYYLVSREPGAALLPLWRDWPHRLVLAAFRGTLFALTDHKAPNQRVIRIYPQASGVHEVTELIPEQSRPITSMTLVGNVLLLRVAATPWTTVLQAYSLDGAPITLSGLPIDGTIEGVRASAASEPIAYVESSGLCRRPSIHRVETECGSSTLFFQPAARTNLPEIETITTTYRSSDDVQVPIRISRRRDFQGVGPQPTMLTAYGGFGVVDSMRYTNRSALWLAMGGIYVHAGVRGGGELGMDWHRDGRLNKKENTFRDFIAAAEWLIANGYTTPKLLAIVGGSNAGLVVGVAMTQRPDLFGAVVCSGPLLDMLRYHLFPGGSIGRSEYGSPENPNDAAILRGYSPYHNVHDGVAYPSALFISGDADTRCDPMHVRKMAARLQEASSGGAILLDYRINKGHSGLMPLRDRIDSLTNQFVFLIQSLGLQLTCDGQFDARECYRSATVTPS